MVGIKGATQTILSSILRNSPFATLMLYTYVEEKRARVRQMWLRTGLDRTRRT